MNTGASTPDLTIRDATPQDTATVLGLIRALAEYEKLAHEVVATEALLHEALFGAQPKAHGLICDIDSKPVGFAIWFYSFSTFLARPGIYLEDLYVVPECRGQGVGAAVFRHLAKRAVAEKCGRFEWAVLNWNEPAIKFYERMGSAPMTEWHVRRLSGDKLKALAA